MKEILAVIPARGGSKGLQDKNIRPLAGHPLIAYSIKAALETPHVTRTIVSTDSQAIAEIALKYGAEVPFMRPSAYAGDLSTDLEVFQHALSWLKNTDGYTPDLVLQLRPTSPFRTAEMLSDCINRLLDSDCDSLRVVTKAFHTPYKMWKVESDKMAMTPLLNLDSFAEHYNQPRQSLPEIYWQTGTLDVIKPYVITEQNSMSGGKILPFIIDQQFAADIDDLRSFELAEYLIREHNCIKFML